ncbi:MAG: NUDIX hydrolase [Bryobacteraceae bacterium]|nr:NUDIX hydrolase [Bryobacteraceae bacterium]
MNPDNRRYPNRPIIGVGALVFQRGRILLVERGKEPLKGYWSIPGGVVEVGERLEEAVRREVLEETGLEVKPLGVFEIFERIIRDAEGRPEYHYVLVDYLCRVVGGAACAADDACAVRWVKRRDLAACRITEGTLEVIARAFRKRTKR